jgi:beta-glucosidase
MGRIDDLLSTMTLEEKIGQLNTIAAPQAITGPAALRDIEVGVRSGQIGSLLNVWGAAQTRSLQRLATNECRLGVLCSLGWMSFTVT